MPDLHKVHAPRRSTLFAHQRNELARLQQLPHIRSSRILRTLSSIKPLLKLHKLLRKLLVRQTRLYRVEKLLPVRGTVRAKQQLNSRVHRLELARLHRRTIPVQILDLHILFHAGNLLHEPRGNNNTVLKRGRTVVIDKNQRAVLSSRNLFDLGRRGHARTLVDRQTLVPLRVPHGRILWRTSIPGLAKRRLGHVPRQSTLLQEDRRTRVGNLLNITLQSIELRIRRIERVTLCSKVGHVLRAELTRSSTQVMTCHNERRILAHVRQRITVDRIKHHHVQSGMIRSLPLLANRRKELFDKLMRLNHHVTYLRLERTSRTPPGRARQTSNLPSRPLQLVKTDRLKRRLRLTLVLIVIELVLHQLRRTNHTNLVAALLKLLLERTLILRTFHERRLATLVGIRHRPQIQHLPERRLHKRSVCLTNRLRKIRLKQLRYRRRRRIIPERCVRSDLTCHARSIETRPVQRVQLVVVQHDQLRVRSVLKKILPLLTELQVHHLHSRIHLHPLSSSKSHIMLMGEHVEEPAVMIQILVVRVVALANTLSNLTRQHASQVALPTRFKILDLLQAVNIRVCKSKLTLLRGLKRGSLCRSKRTTRSIHLRVRALLPPGKECRVRPVENNVIPLRLVLDFRRSAIDKLNIDRHAFKIPKEQFVRYFNVLVLRREPVFESLQQPKRVRETYTPLPRTCRNIRVKPGHCHKIEQVNDTTVRERSLRFTETSAL